MKKKLIKFTLTLVVILTCIIALVYATYDNKDLNPQSAITPTVTISIKATTLPSPSIVTPTLQIINFTLVNDDDPEFTHNYQVSIPTQVSYLSKEVDIDFFIDQQKILTIAQAPDGSGFALLKQHQVVEVTNNFFKETYRYNNLAESTYSYSNSYGSNATICQQKSGFINAIYGCISDYVSTEVSLLNIKCLHKDYLAVCDQIVSSLTLND